MKQERLSIIRLELEELKKENSDIETLQIYTELYYKLEREIYDLQENIVSRVENIL